MNSSMEKPYVVGIDIGGTNTVFGIVDARGTIIASGAVKTQVYPTVEEYADGFQVTSRYFITAFTCFRAVKDG